MTSGSKDESYWLSTPLVASGTVKTSCQGCFRAACAVEVVLEQHNELHLLSVSSGGQLESVFKQPLFCTVKQTAVIPFSKRQPTNLQTQVCLLLPADTSVHKGTSLGHWPGPVCMGAQSAGPISRIDRTPMNMSFCVYVRQAHPCVMVQHCQGG